MERKGYEAGDLLLITSEGNPELSGADIYTLRVEEEEGIKTYRVSQVTDEYDKHAWVTLVKSEGGKEIREKIQKMDQHLKDYDSYHVEPDDEFKKGFKEATGEEYNHAKHQLKRMPRDATGNFDYEEIYRLFVEGDHWGFSGKELDSNRRDGMTEIIGAASVGAAGAGAWLLGTKGAAPLTNLI